ncbi:DUF3617 domain-containing protein [Sphingomonas sp. ASY06-1R]|jgi:hypothetical protein|uniref:DUF3617 domain-containing protein n=1 Tax=Sphingomonas sp. ASY06-1R TaxID=3445771 RepID=UPI003FA20102
MRKLLHAVIPLPFLLAAAPAPPLSPGLWEHTIVYVVDRVSGSSLVAEQAQAMLPSPPPYRDCYTAAAFADPQRFLLASKSIRCRFARFAMANGQISAAGACTDSRYPTVRIDGAGPYDANGFDFSFSGQARSGDVTVDFRGRDSGRRVGACPAGGAGG